MLSLKQPLDDETIDHEGKSYPVIGVNNKKYPLDLSYDNVLRWYELMDDDTVNSLGKVEFAFMMFVLGCDLKTDIDTQIKIVQSISEYVSGGKKEKVEPSDIQPKQYYSFDQDADIIFASFMQEYKIDLIEQQGFLRWEKFIALLNGLRDTTKFAWVVSIRAAKLPTGNTEFDQSERLRLIRLKQMYAISPTKQSVEQQEKMMDDMFEAIYKSAKR